MDTLIGFFGTLIGNLLAVLFSLTDFLVNLIPGIQQVINAISVPISLIGQFPALLIYASHINPIIWNALIFTLILSFTWKPIVTLVKWSIDAISKLFTFFA